MYNMPEEKKLNSRYYSHGHRQQEQAQNFFGTLGKFAAIGAGIAVGLKTGHIQRGLGGGLATLSKLAGSSDDALRVVKRVSEKSAFNSLYIREEVSRLKIENFRSSMMTSGISEARRGQYIEYVQASHLKAGRLPSRSQFKNASFEIAERQERDLVASLYENSLKAKLSPAAKNQINANREKFNNLITQGINDEGIKRNWFHKMMDTAGYELASIKRLEQTKDGIQGNFKISGHGRRAKLERQGFDAQALGINPEAAADPLVFVNKKTNEILDMRKLASVSEKGFDFLSTNFEIPFIKLNPLRLFHPVDIRESMRKPIANIYRIGEKQANITGSNQALNAPLAHINKNVYKTGSTGVELLKENVRNVSTLRGAIPRLMGKMAGHNLKPYDSTTYIGNIKRLLGLGNQDDASMFREAKDFFAKFSNPAWERNIVEKLRKGDFGSIDQTKKDINAISGLLNKTIASPDDELLGLLGAGDKFDNVAIMEMIAGIANKRNDVIGRQAGRLFDDFATNPTVFQDARRTMHNQDAILSEVNVFSKIDDARKVIAKDKILDFIKDHSELELMTKLGDKGKDLRILAMLEEASEGITKSGNASSLARTRLIDLMTGNNGEEIAGLVRKHSKVTQKFTDYQEFMEIVGDDYFSSGQHLVAIGRTKAFGAVQAVNESIKSRNFEPFMNWTKAVFGEATAGRKNMQDFTTFSAIPYFLSERMNRYFSVFGLGLGRESLGSAHGIFGELITKRILPAAIAIESWNYLNFEMNNITGTNPKEILATTAFGLNMGITGVRDITGMTDAAKTRREIFPGMELLSEESPIGMPLKFLGLTGANNTSEQFEYLTEGYEANRKGRWWSAGSTTPWSGGRIQSWDPSWFRSAFMQDAEAINTYGSEAGKYAYSWMPNPRNPLGFVTRMIDPYRVEMENYYTRPYLETGGLFSDVPLIGPALDVFPGQILKPTLHMHGDWKGELKRRNEAIKDAAGYGYTTPSGKITPVVGVGPEGISDEEASEYESYVQAVGGSNAKAASKQNLTNINEGIKASAAAGQQLPQGPNGLEYLPVRNRGVADPNIFANGVMNTYDPRYVLGEMWYNATEYSGIYGFMSAMPFGGNDHLFNVPVNQRAEMDTFKQDFWDANLGGLGGDLSEVWRRFYPKERRMNYFNPIPNDMPDWMPGSNYFINFQTGDPYNLINKGSYRLPGKGYKANNELHPDQFGEYGAIDRFNILADVAPYSDEYQYWSKYITHNIDDEDIRKDAAETKRRVSAQKKKERFFPYRFKYSDIDKRGAIVSDIIDQNTFMIEGDDTPYRLAGVRVNADNKEEVLNYIYPGAHITLGYAEDESQRKGSDIINATKAVVWNDGVNINKKLIKSGIGKEKEDDYSAAATWARFSSSEIAQGKVWETFAHIDSPFHTKFLHVRSPLEMYERKEIYGRSWQPWELSAWIEPTLNRIGSQGPILGALAGAGTGLMFGLPTQKGRKWGTRVGAVIGLTMGSIHLARQIFDPNNAPVPSRVKKQREIDEYFDYIEYIKYRRLFDKENALAAMEEDIDVENWIEQSNKQGKYLKGLRRKIDEEKAQNIINNNKEANKGLNDVLNLLASQKGLQNIGPHTLAALEYYNKFTSTLYGADPHGDYTKILQAMPEKEKAYFQEFADAPEKERKRILKIMPKYTRRFLEAQWGKEISQDNRRESLQSFFKDNYLPGPNWGGWSEDVDIDDIKYKVVKQEGLEASEFGLWDDHAYRASMLKVDPPRNFKSNNLNPAFIKNQLTKLLGANGLQDISISVVPSPLEEFSVNFEIQRDILGDIKEALHNNGNSIIGGI